MCISIQKFCQKVVLMFSPENPSRLCQSNSTCCVLWTCMFINFIICILGVAAYFMTIGLGYGMSYGVMRNICDMTTGNYPNGNKCTICFYDGAGGFYGGCFLAGFICVLILGLIGLFIFLLWICFFDCISKGCSNIKSEVLAAFESAEIMEENYMVT